MSRSKAPWLILLTLSALALGACSAPHRSGDVEYWTAGPSSPGFHAPWDVQDAKKDDGKAKKKDDDDDRPGAVHVILLYIPNRILDLFDMFRFGIEVGPGIGIDAEATDALRVGLMTRISAGAGLQTLRHLPIKFDSQAYAGLGPIDLGGSGGISWYRNFWDVRLEVMVLLVGGHAAVNIKEVGDFFLGFLTIDICDDDF